MTPGLLLETVTLLLSPLSDSTTAGSTGIGSGGVDGMGKLLTIVVGAGLGSTGIATDIARKDVRRST